MACNDLATKSELNNLRNSLENQVNNLSFQKADKSSLNNLEIKTASLGGDTWKPDFHLLEVAIAAITVAVNSLKPLVYWSRDRINELTKNLNQVIADLKDLAKGVADNRKDINQIKKDLQETKNLALYLEIEMKNVKSKANEATTKANEAINRSNILLNSVNAVISKANHADQQAAEAMKQANLAILGAVTARDTLNQLIVKTDAINSQAIQAMQQANTAYQIGNIAQSQANLAIAKSEGLTTEINNIKESVKQVKGDIELLKIKDLQQALKNIDIGFELDGLKLTNYSQTDEIERLKTQLATTNLTGIIDNKIAANNQLIGAGAGGAISTKLEGLQADSADTKRRIGTIENSLTAINAKTQTLEQAQAKQQADINELDMNSTQKLGGLENALGGIGLAIGGIAITTGQIAQQTAPAALATAAEVGTCNASKPGGCLGGQLNNIKQGLDNSLTNMAGLGTIAAQNAANTLNILNLLNTVWSYLQTFGSLVTGKFEKLWEHRLVDRALVAANLAVTIHNAVMLSNNIFLTLGQAIDNIGELIGIKAPEGASTTITGAIGKTFESLAKSVIGAENYTTLSINFAKANRIYQAGVNILDATTAMFYGVSEGLETIARMGGKIGNACKKSGIFIESSIDWFSERFTFKVGRLGGIMRFLQGTQEVAESIEQISSNALEVVQNANQINQEVTDLQKDIKDLEDKKKTDETKSKTDSKQPTTTEQDTIKPSPS